ncbi:MAG: hypothetical protein RR705_05715 [Lachnospiraceae bacterium]
MSEIPDKIKDRLLKLKRLAEQGYKGEALAARRALEAMLEKYGFTIDDLCDEKQEWRWIKVGSNRELKSILHQCHFQVVDGCETIYKEYKGEIAFKLTPAQYADLMSLFEFHSVQFKKERSRLLKNLVKAYVQKHEIWGLSDKDDSTEKSQKEKNPIGWDEIKATLSLMEAMENVSYHKQLE